MAADNRAPGAGITGGAGRVSRSGSADTTSITDTEADVQALQAAIIARRFGLAPAVARQVAEQAFGAGGAA